MSSADLLPSAPFVSTAWLADHLGDADVVPIDGSWYLPTQNRSGKSEFLEGHVPGAVFFDIDALSDPTSGLPHMLLDAETFGEEAGFVGIPSDATLVVYDGAGLFSAPRVWWTLRMFGARQVRVLDGGLPRWKAEGRALEAGPSRREPAEFTARAPTEGVADLTLVRRLLAEGGAQVVDARPAARFTGEAPEPRPGLASGHMPGSRNVPFSEVVRDGTLQPPAELRQTFTSAGVDLDRPVVTTCGSGVSAAILVLALTVLGKDDVALYDGSWAEYGSQPDAPVATGPALAPSTPRA